MSTVSAAPTRPMTTPPIAGPSRLASHSVPCSFPLASSRFSLPTTRFRKAWLADANTSPSKVFTMVTAQSCATDSTPYAHATGTDAISTNRMRSAATITGRFERRSTQAPAGSANTAVPIAAHAVMSDVWKIVVCSTTTPTSGSASAPTCEPMSLTA